MTKFPLKTSFEIISSGSEAKMTYSTVFVVAGMTKPILNFQTSIKSPYRYTF